MKFLLKSPTMHFLLIGALLFAANSWRTSAFGERERGIDSSKTIVISAAEIQRLRRDWIGRNGRFPDEREDRGLIEHAVDEHLLFHEAIARGFDRHDDVVRRRLVELATFLADDPKADEQTLVEEARALGLDRTDLVIRRRLIERMRLAARLPEAPKPVTDAELQQALDREPDRYRLPPTVTLTHVYLSRSRRGGAVERDARRLLEKLRSTNAPPEEATALGDAFPLNSRLTGASDRDLERRFGAAFAAALANVASGEWAGPIRSDYGEHLVWVHARVHGRTPRLETVRTQVLESMREERANERLGNTLRRLRDGYAIRIADGTTSASLPISSASSCASRSGRARPRSKRTSGRPASKPPSRSARRKAGRRRS